MVRQEYIPMGFEPKCTFANNKNTTWEVSEIPSIHQYLIRSLDTVYPKK